MIKHGLNYWLYISSKTYCCIKGGNAILYNTENGSFMKVENEKIIKLLNALHEKDNLGSIYCSATYLFDEAIQEFIYEFCEKNMGGLLQATDETERPVQMMPILSLQRDIDRTNIKNDLGRNILHYLSQINIYLNNDCGQSCDFCEIQHKQCLSCLKGDNSGYLNIEDIGSFISQLRQSAVSVINILGGNPFNYPHLDELFVLLKNFKGKIHLWNHYMNFASYAKISKDITYNILVPNPIKKEEVEKCALLFKNSNSNVLSHFFITNESEYINVESVVSLYQINNYIIHPIYTKNNKHFFYEYVYLSEEEILHHTISFRKIFALQKLNTNDFGCFTILSNGEVFANINCISLGNIRNQTILQLIKKELIVNTAWRKIRDNAPCTKCCYQFLCPSPSNYEQFFNIPNFCTVI